MQNTSYSIERRNEATSPLCAAKGEPERAVCAGKDQTAANHFRRGRLDRITIGFWLGGGVLGMGGCILGASMPYHHPVALMIGALWWGFYLGCFGGSVGALIALFTERAPAPSSRGVDGRGLSVAPATIPADCSLSHKERVACYDRKPESERCPKRMDEHAENLSLLVIGQGASKE
jgi:hypothetical protein